MARRKSGLDYFPVDIDMDQDDKVYRIVAKCGEVGFGRLIRLLAEVYRSGYFKRWTEDVALVFAGKKAIPIDDVRALVAAAVDAGFFDRRLYDAFGILTSAGIQRRYIEGAAKRDRISLLGVYLLVDVQDLAPGLQRKLVLQVPAETTDGQPADHSGEKCASIVPAETQSRVEESKGEYRAGTDSPECKDSGEEEDPDPFADLAGRPDDPPELTPLTAPHMQLALDWYREYQRRTGRLIGPSEKDNLEAEKACARASPEILTAAILPYFDRPWWFARDKATGQASYSFRGFLRHIEEILAGTSTEHKPWSGPRWTCKHCQAVNTHTGMDCDGCHRNRETGEVAERATAEDAAAALAAIGRREPPKGEG